MVKVFFKFQKKVIQADGTETKVEEIKEVDAHEGDSIFEIAHHLKDTIPLEGACEGSLACSTCHVILEQKYFNKLPEASEKEEDMLDQAFGLSSTSRLGCQVIITKDLEGATFSIPHRTNNFKHNE